MTAHNSLKILRILLLVGSSISIFSAPPIQAQEFLKDLITQSPGDLSNPHQDWDKLSGCISCHVKQLGGELDDTKCLSCHPKIDERVKAARGYHRDKNDCSQCHSEHLGKDGYIFAPIRSWEDGYVYGAKDQPQKTAAPFNHARDAQWQLVGKHQKVECSGCHDQKREHYQTKQKTKTTSYLFDKEQECIDCHSDVYFHDFKKEEWLACTDCHSSNIQDWKRLAKPMKFRHDATDYKLRGLHTDASCESCHSPDPKLRMITNFEPLNFGKCTDCHYDVHEDAFGQDCEECHSVFKKWDNVQFQEGAKSDFDHDKARFPLRGYHEAVACESCHYREDKSFKYEAGGFDECSDCHGFPHDDQFKDQKCESCHPEDLKFNQPIFGINEHNQLDFKLDGKHQVIDCNKCHFSGKFEGLKSDECSDCHRNVHPERQIDQTCNFCHVTTSFSWIQFNHNEQTDFNLTGKHRDVSCLSCHVEQVFKNMPADNENPNCQMCHADPHGEAIQNDCASCHNTEGFKLVKAFNHTEYGWDLEGRHSELSCQRCHSEHLVGDYKVPLSKKGLQATDCANCHNDIHNNEYGPNCQSCHTQTTFEVTQGEKVHDLGFFKLEGYHDQMECSECHSSNTNLQGQGIVCAWCHEKNDIHLGQFGLQCSDCHSQTAWMPVPKFKHNTTGFRLTGAHRYADCQSCHLNNTYQGLPTDCYFCHVDSYLETVTLHAGGRGASIQDCESCHTTIDWGIVRGSGIQ